MDEPINRELGDEEPRSNFYRPQGKAVDSPYIRRHGGIGRQMAEDTANAMSPDAPSPAPPDILLRELYHRRDRLQHELNLLNKAIEMLEAEPGLLRVHEFERTLQRLGIR